METVSAQTYTLTSGTTWAVPAGAVRIRVECWGGGGGGSYRTSTGSGGGGGGGAYAMYELCVTSGSSVSYSIGAGGLGSSGTSHGGDTWFSSTTTVLAQGGRGVADNTSTGASGGTVAASVGTVRYAGGNGGEGYSSSFWGRLGGGGGGAATTTSGGNNGADGWFAGVGTGGTSTAPGGSGGNGGDNNNGTNGNNYGGGGGGSGRNSGNRNGGNGAPGMIRITILTTYTLDAGPDATTASAGDNVTLSGIANPTTITGISYTQDFNGCNSGTCNNWFLNGGAANNITATVATGYTPCSNSSAKSNIYNSYPWVELISNTSLGTSNGEPITLSFSAKCINYSNGNASAAGACTFSGYWSTNGVTWTLIGPGINNISSTSCNTYTLPTFSAPAGSFVYILIAADRNSGDFWAVFDDISLTQPSITPIISWSGGPIVSGNSTTTPTVNPDYTTIYTMSTTVGGCPVTDNATVTVTSPLAITLSKFSAKCNESKIDIHWKTDAEFNSDYFTLERSRDGMIWEVVTTVSATGSHNSTTSYHATDIAATEVYYRLKETDLDGKSEYHGPIIVNCDNGSNELIVYPNPNNGKFTVAVNTKEAMGDATILVQDVTGKTVASQNINVLSGTNTVLFENTNLIRGTYIVSILGKEKNTFTPVKLVIQ